MIHPLLIGKQNDIRSFYRVFLFAFAFSIWDNIQYDIDLPRKKGAV